MDAGPVELRVLGCLIEKQRTTPDVYPLSVNALRLACNQSTNRDLVVDYDEPTIRDALQRLSTRGWARLASGRGSRAVKYRHLFDEALGVNAPQISVLAVLMLRGTADDRRAQAANGAPASVRVAGGGRRDVERARTARPRDPARPPPGPEGRALGAALGRRGDSPGTVPTVPPADDRVEALERRVGELERRLAVLEGVQRDGERDHEPTIGVDQALAETSST